MNRCVGRVGFFWICTTIPQDVRGWHSKYYNSIIGMYQLKLSNIWMRMVTMWLWWIMMCLSPDTEQAHLIKEVNVVDRIWRGICYCQCHAGARVLGAVRVHMSLSYGSLVLQDANLLSVEAGIGQKYWKMLLTCQW